MNPVFVSLCYQPCRGVQYVHCVMHNCIMVKVRGKRNTHKVCKKQVNILKTRGKFFKVGGNNNFRETGGKCTEIWKIGRGIRNLWSMTKKSSEMLVDENRKIFREKVKFIKTFHSLKICQNRGEI